MPRSATKMEEVLDDLVRVAFSILEHDSSEDEEAHVWEARQLRAKFKPIISRLIPAPKRKAKKKTK